MRTIQTYFKLAFADVRSQMQHQASFWMNTVGNLIASGGSFVMIWALFASFGKLGEWSMAEIAVLYGIVNSAYALAEGVGRGFERFNQLVKTGDFDRVLLRPCGTLFQILSSKVEAARAGRLIQAVGALWLGHAAGCGAGANRADPAVHRRRDAAVSRAFDDAGGGVLLDGGIH